MSRRLLGLALLVVLAGCAGQDVGRRYRAERELAGANQRYYLLSAALRRTTDEAWRSLAKEYARIAAGCLPAGGSSSRPTSVAGRELEELAARALFSAAQIYSTLQDSIRVDQIYQQMSTAFSGLPNIAGEVLLSRARIAESRGELDVAIAYYRKIVEQFEPHAGEPGIAGSVLALPLRIDRLTARTSDAPGDSTHFAPARAYYRKILAEAAAPELTAGARGHLADIAVELEQWAEAAHLLQQLERQLRQMDAPIRRPADVRYGAVLARAQLEAYRDSLYSDVESLVADYPHSEAAPRALLTLAETVRKQGQPEAALRILDRLIREYDDVKVTPDAMLLKGQLLDRMDRWKEALSTYRELKVEYPITHAALRTHLEIAEHYLRVGNGYARMEALEQAQRAYREFLDRYPENPFTFQAWELLIRTLTLEQRHQQAVDEMLSLSDHVAGSSKEPQMLIEAARMAVTQLGDTSRAVAILERAAQRFPQTRIGTWSSHEADRLRRGGAR